MYSAFMDLVITCSAILTIGAIGVIGAFFFGFFGTRKRATKTNEWVFNYSLRSGEFEDDSSLPFNRGEAIYFPSLTASVAYVVGMLIAFKLIVVNANAKAIYSLWLVLYRSSYNDGAIGATRVTTVVLMLAVVISMGFAMRFGRRLKTAMLQRKCTKCGYTVPVRSRGILVYPICFLGNFATAVYEKISKKASKVRR